MANPATTNNSGLPDQSNLPLSQFKPVKPKKRPAGEDDLLHSNAYELEDEFLNFYYDPTTSQGLFLMPPYNPHELCHLVQVNNALNQCISAMEVNIDGTGYEVETEEETAQSAEEDETATKIKAFFDEPYPRTSFITMRRLLRRHLEETGNAYLEVIRNLEGDLVFLKPIDPKFMRLVKLDGPTPVEVTVMRNGQQFTATTLMRERRFAQKVGPNHIVFFREYGSSRDLNKRTGEWAPTGEKLDADIRATEVIHFTLDPDVDTPYGVPRWINQIPSVLGSRKAEEHNLDFFDAGGVPPALIVVAGGQMVPETRRAVEQQMSGKRVGKSRAAVLEVMSSGGSLDGRDTTPKVSVERFGSEFIKDSMFENYDEKCEMRVRRSFRLPPLFVGDPESYNFATAFVSYNVAEAQVFKPERDEFDEIINVTIMRELDPTGKYAFRSMPLSINDINNQLRALMLAMPMAEDENIIETLNQLTNLNMKADPEKIEANREILQNAAKGMGAQGPGGPIPKNPEQAELPQGVVPRSSTVHDVSVKAELDPIEVVKLAADYAAYATGVRRMTQGQVKALNTVVKSMTPVQREVFDNIVATHVLKGYERDPKGMTELVGCAALGHDHAEE